MLKRKFISDGDYFQLVHMLTDELNDYFVLMEQDDPGQSYSSFSFFWSHCCDHVDVVRDQRGLVIGMPPNSLNFFRVLCQMFKVSIIRNYL